MNPDILSPTESRQEWLPSRVVSASQMITIEEQVFAAGLPVAALMEKAAGFCARRVIDLFPQTGRVGILVGPGHNGGDALVIARELHFAGYSVHLYTPIVRLKPLTANHARYAESLGIPFVDHPQELLACDWLIDGLFGVGLTRSLDGAIATLVQQMNDSAKPVVSIDLPSGIHSDSGEVLGIAVQATHTLCLGLWKLAFLQEVALPYLGSVELVDIGLPRAVIDGVLGSLPSIQRLTTRHALAALPLTRSPVIHKYQVGHLLLVAGSWQYPGAVILAGLAARASGVGLLSIAVPARLKPLVLAHLPDAIVIDCPETACGAIAALPADLPWSSYSAIACGSGLTIAAHETVQQVLATPLPVVCDADALSLMAAWGTEATLRPRQAATVLTPHAGEFERLFPHLLRQQDRIQATQTAAQTCGAIVVLKGARTVIATPSGRVTINPESTPALARGGSGDVLTGLLGGLWAQAGRQGSDLEAQVKSAVWWHAQAGLWVVQQRTVLGVDAQTLAAALIPTLAARRDTPSGSSSAAPHPPKGASGIPRPD